MCLNVKWDTLLPVCDGEYAGQLELVDSEMGRDRTTQVLILLPELSS